MRIDNTRCRNMRTCERLDFGDHAGPDKAVLLRDQILQQIKPFKNEASMPDSHVWTDIENKVVMLMGWVLCKKHMTHRHAVVPKTMRFLKQECGMFVEEQKQPHSKEFALINDKSASPKPGSGAPYSTYASAASHLATPPMSPRTLAQEMVYRRCSTSGVTRSLDDGAAFDASFKPPQQFPLVLHTNTPNNTEPATESYGTHCHRISPSTTPREPLKTNGASNNTGSEKQRAPCGFGVRKPSKTRLLSGRRTKQPLAKHSDAQQGPSVHRNGNHAPVAQPCLPETSSSPNSTHGKHRDSFDVAGPSVTAQSSRSEMNQLIERLKATELRNQKLEDERYELEGRIERLEDNNQRLLVANKQLLEAKKHYKELYQDTKDRLGELEGEDDGLEDELDESREHIVKLEEELAMLRRPARGRSLRRRED